MNISFSMENEKKKLLRWDSNPQHTAYEADALPTELPRHIHIHVCTYVHVINPRHGCAARVTVVVLCVCLCVCLSGTLFWQYAQLKV